MNFEQKLTSLLKDEKFIEHSGTYSHDFLKKLFLENISNNLEICIREIAIKLNEQETWSFINFLRTVYEDNQSEFSLEDKEKIRIFTKDGLRNSSTHDDVYTSLLRLFSLLPIEKTELIELSNYILKNRKAYTILEALSFDLSELIPDEKIFLEVFLTTLNAPRGNYLGLSWHEKFWEIIAKHPDRKWFFDQLLVDTNKDAADEFLAKGKKAGESLLNSLDDNKATINETIAFFRDFFTKLSPNRTWYGHESNKAKELLGLVLNYAQKNNISFHSDLPFLFDENTFWHTEDILAQYISEKDILEFYEKVEFKEMHIIRLYEAIQYGKREDKEDIMLAIEGLTGFGAKMHEVKIARENANKQSEAYSKKFHEKIKREIREGVKYTKENEISPRLLEYFFREDYNKLFKGKYREEAIKQLQRFLDWELFNLDIQVYERFVDENGKVDYRGGYWYSVEFFTKALETAKELNIDIHTKKIEESIVRAFLLYNTSDLKKLYEYLERDITDKEVDLLLNVLQKGHISNARYHLSGQNIFPVFERYEKVFLRKKYREKVIELFKSIITDEDFEEWWRASPLDHLNGELRKEILPWLKSHWENIVDKKRNYIETFDRWGLVLKLNTILIQENNDGAIHWRLDQFQSAKVKSLSFDDRRRGQSGNLHFRGVSDIESELDFDKTLWKGLKDIDARKYQKKLLSIIKHALNFLKEEEGQETKLLSSYARYLINGVFSIESFIYQDAITLAETLVKKYTGEARKIGLWSIANARQNLVEKLITGDGVKEIPKKLEKNILPQQEFHEEMLECKEVIEENKRLVSNIEDLENKNNQLETDLNDVRLRNIELKKQLDEKTKQLDGIKNSGVARRKDRSILTEGPTDILHLEKAWHELGYGEINFDIQTCHGSKFLPPILNQSKDFYYNITVGIFDLDSAGIEEWHKVCGSSTFKITPRNNTVSEGESLVRGGKTSNGKYRYAITLPLLQGIKVISSDSIASYIEGLSGTKSSGIKITIESMYYGIDEGINKKFFNEDGSIKDTGEGKINKDTFHNDIYNFAKELPGFDDMKNLYKNFEILFQTLEDIFSGKYDDKKSHE